MSNYLFRGKLADLDPEVHALTQIEADPSSLPLDKNLWIITYCT